MNKKVIDVSKHNGKIDWSKVKNSVDGAIIRCGYGDDYTAQDDQNFVENVEGCIKNGIPFGVYIYSYAKTKEQAISEANHVLRLIKPYKDKMDYPVYLDLEEHGTEEGAVDRAIIFGDIIEKEKLWCGIYANEFWWNTYLKDKLDRFTKWVAKYSKNKPNNISNGYAMWQYTSEGHIDGISGNVDVSECYQTFKKLTSTSNRKTNEQIALEVIEGKWGNGSERVQKLTASGYDAKAIQKIVNTMLKV